MTLSSMDNTIYKLRVLPWVRNSHQHVQIYKRYIVKWKETDSLKCNRLTVQMSGDIWMIFGDGSASPLYYSQAELRGKGIDFCCCCCFKIDMTTYKGLDFEKNPIQNLRRRGYCIHSFRFLLQSQTLHGRLFC